MLKSGEVVFLGIEHSGLIRDSDFGIRDFHRPAITAV